MHIDFLSTVLVVEDTGCLTRAAELLDVSSSTIHKRIKKVEEYYQLQLFEKYNGKFVLTNEGCKLIDSLKAINDLNKSIFEKNERGEIHIAANQGVGIQLVNDFLSDYIKKNENVSLKVSTITSPKSLDSFDGDFAITSEFGNNDNYNYHYVSDFEFYFVASLDYLEEYGEPTTVEDLENHMVLRSTHEYVDDEYMYCQNIKGEQLRFKLKSQIYADSKIVLNRFIERGNGIGLVPAKILSLGLLKNVKTLFGGEVCNKCLVNIAIRKNVKLTEEAYGLMEAILNKYKVHDFNY